VRSLVPAVVAVCFFSLALPCHAQTFVLNGVSNCPGLAEAYNVALTGGTYNIQWVSGSWSPISDDAIYGGFAWSARVKVYIYSSALGGTIGVAGPPDLYSSPELAEAAARGTYVLVVPTNSTVAFYLDELFGSCSDNRGSVTLRFVSPLTTEPSTWGAVKALYR
jgi:hypothetical protein